MSHQQPHLNHSGSPLLVQTEGHPSVVSVWWYVWYVWLGGSTGWSETLIQKNHGMKVADAMATENTWNHHKNCLVAWKTMAKNDNVPSQISMKTGLNLKSAFLSFLVGLGSFPLSHQAHEWLKTRSICWPCHRQQRCCRTCSSVTNVPLTRYHLSIISPTAWTIKSNQRKPSESKESCAPPQSWTRACWLKSLVCSLGKLI